MHVKKCITEALQLVLKQAPKSDVNGGDLHDRGAKYGKAMVSCCSNFCSCFLFEDRHAEICDNNVNL